MTDKKINKLFGKLEKIVGELHEIMVKDSTDEEKALEDSLKACDAELTHLSELRQDEHTRRVSEMTVYELRQIIREEISRLDQHSFIPYPPAQPMFYRDYSHKFDVFCKEGEE